MNIEDMTLDEIMTKFNDGKITFAEVERFINVMEKSKNLCEIQNPKVEIDEEKIREIVKEVLDNLTFKVVDEDDY